MAPRLRGDMLRRCPERNESMKARKHHEEPIDRQLFQELKQVRERGGITDDDRVVFFAPDEPIRLYSAFGYGADSKMFNGIVAANFRALNPDLVTG